MSDARPHDEPGEVEALTDQTQVDESAGPDDEGVPPTVEGGDGGSDAASEVSSGAPEQGGSEPSPDATDDTGQPVEEAGTGTADTSDDPELDSPD